MSQRLTFPEIKARYAPDWVLIGDPESDENLEILSGEVLFHSPSRDELDRRMLKLRPAHFALDFLGELPADLEFLLSINVDGSFVT